MRFVLQTVKSSAPPASQSTQPIPRTATTAAPAHQPQAAKHSTTAAKQPPTVTTSVAVQPPAVALTTAKSTPATLPASTVAAAPRQAEETKEAAVDEVRLRFDTTYSEAADSSRREDDESEYDEEDEDEQDEYSGEDEEADLGAPSVAINCSYSINPTSVLQRSHHFSQEDDDDDEQAIEEEDDEEEDEEQDDDKYEEEEKQQYEEDEQQAAAEVEEEEEEVEQETQLHHFVAVDASVTHISHSQTAPVDSDNNNHDDSEDEQDEAADDDSLQLHAFQPHAFQPHTIHIQPMPHNEEKEEDEDGQDETEEHEACSKEEEDGVSELCTVQIHQHSLITQAGHSQSHWHAIDTPTRNTHNHNSHYDHPTPTPTQHTQTASFTLNDSADDIVPPLHSTTHSPVKRSVVAAEAGEWNEAEHERRVAALQVELKERVEARRRKLRRASYMEEMEEKRLHKELEAKQRALQQLRLLRVKQEAQQKLAALALQKQKDTEERERKERRDKENQQSQQLPTPTQQHKQPSHHRTPSSIVMRKRIKQAHYDRLLKAVERGDTFTKYYDSWYCKPKPKFVRVVCLSSSASSGGSGGSAAASTVATQPTTSETAAATMKLTWGSDMFNMDKSLDLSSVVKVQRGSECAVASKLPVQLHSRAFSLSTAEGRTLHLVASTQATREVWLSFVLLIMERRRQPLVELNGAVVVSSEMKGSEEVKAGSDGTGGGSMGERVRRSMGGRLSVGRLSLGRLSLGGKNNN